MFAVSSEISLSVIVKHKQHIGIIRAFCLLGGTFSVPGATEKIAEKIVVYLG